MLKMPVILIDNGHGKDTPGKRSPDAVAGKLASPLYFREFSWTRQCAQGIVDVLQAEGYTAFLLVKEEEDVPLKERTNRVAAYCRTYGVQNVLLISIHVNAADKGQKWMNARGWSIYTSPGETASDRLATEIHAAAVPELTEREYARTFLPTSKQKAIRTDFSDGDPDYEAKVLDAHTDAMPGRPVREYVPGQQGGRGLPEERPGPWRLHPAPRPRHRELH